MAHCSDSNYRLLSARFLRRHAKQLAAELDGICRDEDIECIHRGRVASRRLRAAMDMFRDCWDRKELKIWRKQIRRITGELGDARDKDVQSQYLCGILGAAADAALSPGIARLLAHIEHQREALQPGVAAAVEQLRQSKILRCILRKTKKVLHRTLTPSAGPSEFTYAETKRFVFQRLQELLQEEDGLQHPEDASRHHAMRIAAKRLRYTMEIAKPVYAGHLEKYIEPMRKVQSLLGDIHDCDVWIGHLDEFSRQECGRILAASGSAVRCARLEAGIKYLKQDRSRRRAEAFEALVVFWRELKLQGTWERMSRMIELCGVEPPSEKPSSPHSAAAAPPKLNGSSSRRKVPHGTQRKNAGQ
jgi:CHAD domain-containing protein